MEPRLTPDRALAEVREGSHRKVKVAICDVDGVLRGKYMHRDKFLSAAEKGFGFCNVVFGWDVGDECYDDARYTGWHTGYPDACARVDLTTLRRVPWDDDVPFFLADFVEPAGGPLAVCPRQTLKRVIGRARKLGFEPKVGLEFEWFNFAETPQSIAAKGFAAPTPLTPGMFGYSLLRAGLHRGYFNALMDQLDRFCVPLEGLHTETGPGVYEAAICASDALEAADRGALFKSSVKEIAYGFGILPSFMAKWNEALPGCSGHIHQSLWDRGGETNVFRDEDGRHHMSEVFRRYLAGQAQLAGELCALYCPTVNSYKRLVEGLWAPTRVTWGADNRTAAFRMIPSEGSAIRLETRLPGADINPYLAVAAAIGSGLYGIEHELDLDLEPVRGDAYAVKDAAELPRTLDEATTLLERSEAAREIFGDDLVDHFVRTRRWEWRQYRQAVTDWELKRYFEII